MFDYRMFSPSLILVFALFTLNISGCDSENWQGIDIIWNCRKIPKVLRLNGGCRGVSVRERWESAGFNLQPDFGPEAHPDVPLEHRLGDAAEFGDTDALRRLIQVGNIFLSS
jgi:hypothetical protein